MSLTSASRLNQRGSGLHDVDCLTDVMFNVALFIVGSRPDDKSLSEPTIKADFLLVYIIILKIWKLKKYNNLLFFIFS